MDRTMRNLAIGLLILVVLTPLGLLSSGETFGEWSNNEIKEKIGFVPSGLGYLAPFWKAPIPDYAFTGDQPQKGAAAAYIFSAIVGVLLCAGLLYFVGKRIAKN